MKKAFHGYIDKYQFFTKTGIYDEHNKYRISEFNRHKATLYFIVRTPKVKFLPKTFRIVSNYCIEGKLEINGKKTEIIFNAAKIWYKLKEAQAKFDDIDDFTDHCMSQWGGPDLKGFTNSQKYAAASNIDTQKSDENYLRINCAIATSVSKGKQKEIIITPYQLINYFDMDCLEELEIIYIGKSNDDTWKRIYNHNKWGIIEEFRDNQDELLVYFMSLDKSSVHRGNYGQVNINSRQESELKIEDATKVMEASMIIHFMNEKKYNIEHVGKDISKVKSVRDELIAKGYDKIIVEVSLDGLFGLLGSSSIPSAGYHKIEYEI